MPQRSLQQKYRYAWHGQGVRTISGVKDCAGMGVQIGPGATAHSTEHSLYTSLLAYVTADSVCQFVNAHAAVHHNE